MRVLSWLDWFNCLALVPLSDPLAAKVAPSIEAEDLQAAIHCVTRDGKIHRGARCIRFAAMRLPMLLPVGLFLWIPGVIQIAEIVYRWVSRNRLVLSRSFGCKGACTIMPKRNRSQDKLA